jgi:hypothetical protein
MTKTHRTGKTETWKDGRNVYEYSDGCWRDDLGRMVIKSPKLAEFNSETGAIAGRKSQESKRKKKQDAIVIAIRDRVDDEMRDGITTAEDAVALVAGALFAETLELDQPLRDRVHTYERIGADAGLVSKYKDGGGATTQAIQINISMNPDAVEETMRQVEILEGHFEEREEDETV